MFITHEVWWWAVTVSDSQTFSVLNIILSWSGLILTQAGIWEAQFVLLAQCWEMYIIAYLLVSVKVKIGEIANNMEPVCIPWLNKLSIFTLSKCWYAFLMNKHAEEEEESIFAHHI